MCGKEWSVVIIVERSCEDVIFVVGTAGVSKTGGTHCVSAGVPDVGYFDRVGGEGSEDIGGG